MSFTDNEKLVKSDKAASEVFDSAPVSPGAKFWYNEDLAWYTNVHANTIWIDADQIPGASNQSEADAAVTANPTLIAKTTVRLTLDLTSNNRLYLPRTTFNDPTTDIVLDWIQPQRIRKNGASSWGYSLRLYNGDPAGSGVELPTTYRPGTGGAPSWEFNYSVGAIKISTDESSHYKGLYDTNGLYIVGYRYIGDKGVSGSSTSYADKIIETYICETHAEVGDVVYFSDDTNSKVEINTNNEVIYPSVGIIIEKITTTNCRVLMFGECDTTYSGLVKGKKVFLDTDGTPTSTPPTEGYVQCLGVCYGEDKLFVKPSVERVKRHPFTT